MLLHPFSDQDHFYMREALKEAQLAFAKEEVPVGALLVRGDKIIARTHNQMEERRDPTAHAEILALRQGSKVLKDWRLLGATLYTTLEPCTMCAGALFLGRVAQLIYGAKDLRHGADGSWESLFDKTHPTHQVEVKRGLLEKECAELMREFFKKRRRLKSFPFPEL